MGGLPQLPIGVEDDDDSEFEPVESGESLDKMTEKQLLIVLIEEVRGLRSNFDDAYGETRTELRKFESAVRSIFEGDKLSALFQKFMSGGGLMSLLSPPRPPVRK
jgi:hypothetical protein